MLVLSHLTKGSEMYSRLAAVMTETGLWSGAREHSHKFLLSPSVYHITKAQRDQLARLGHALHDCMLGLSHIAVIAYDPGLNYNGMWSQVRKVFSTGVPKIYQELQGMNVRHLPKLLKVDLMVDHDGSFKIAEVDGHNKHGMGYSTLGLRFCESLYPEATRLPGTVKMLAALVKRLGHSELKLLYADQERFYIPEFEVAQQEFAKHGVSCVIRSEMEADKEFVTSGLFVDLPFLYHREGLYGYIVPAYKDGEVGFIIPPKPFLGAKGVLALLRNDREDAKLEAMLRAFIKMPSLAFVRDFVPETFLVGTQAEAVHATSVRTQSKKYVLKESISSGMKGTVFLEDATFDSTLARACESQMNWILQEEIVNQPQTFSWFEDDTAHSLKSADDWFMRVTVQYVGRELADVIVTARRDKAVHGAKDCIQIGTTVL